MMKLAILATALLSAAAAQAQTVIYDTFNENDQANLFDCCNATPIQGRIDGSKKSEAYITFTPAADGRITEIDIPLGYTSGVNEVWVELYGVNKGLKHSFRAMNLPGPGQCCAFQALEAKGILVQGGMPYRLRVDPRRFAIVGSWNLNTAGITGSYMVRDGDSKDWREVDGTLPAIRILGR